MQARSLRVFLRTPWPFVMGYSSISISALAKDRFLFSEIQKQVLLVKTAVKEKVSMKKRRGQTKQQKTYIPGATTFDIPATRRNQVVACVFIFCVVMGVYWNTLGNEFVVDDKKIIVENAIIHDIKNTSRIFSSSYWPNLKGGLYRPLPILTYALNYGLSGLNPKSYHVVNVIIHGLNCILLYFLCLLILKNHIPSLFVTMLFSVHPINTEAVAGVVGRADLLAFFFSVGAILMYVNREKSKGRKNLLYFLSLFSFCLALLSKENAITLVGVLVAYDFVFAYDTDLKKFTSNLFNGSRHFRCYLGFIVVVFFYLFIRFKSTGSIFIGHIPFIENPLVQASLYYRTLTAFKIFGKYLTLIFYPVNLSIDYSYNQIPVSVSPFEPQTLLGITLFFAAGIFGFYKKSKQIVFAILFFLMTYSIVSNSFVLIGTIMNERLMYLSSAGFFIFIVLFSKEVVATLRLKVDRTFSLASVLIIMLFVLSFLSYKSVKRNYEWKNDRTLYESALRTSAHSAKVYAGLGEVYGKTGDVWNAVFYYKKALGIYTHYRDVHRNIANAYYERAMFQEAASHYEKYLKYDKRDPAIYNALVATYAKLKDKNKAKFYFERAIKINPNYAEPYFNFGFLYYNTGYADKAIPYWEKAIQISPSLAEPYKAMGIVYMDRKQYDKAIFYFNERVRRQPDDAGTYWNLGLIYAYTRKYDNAARYFKKSAEVYEKLRQTNDASNAYNNAGKAYFTLKNYNEAVKYFRKSLDINPKNQSASKNLNIAITKTGFSGGVK